RLLRPHEQTAHSLRPSPPPHPASSSLHDALPISTYARASATSCRSPTLNPSPRSPTCVYMPSERLSTQSARPSSAKASSRSASRSEEHTSELQSRENLVCRLLLEKKK